MKSKCPSTDPITPCIVGYLLELIYLCLWIEIFLKESFGTIYLVRLWFYYGLACGEGYYGLQCWMLLVDQWKCYMQMLIFSVI